MNVVGDEAERERAARLAGGPDSRPLLRTLLRLRHDLVIIGRAATVLLPETFTSRLEAPLVQIGKAFADYLRASGAALQASQRPPSLDAVESALGAYAAEIEALRSEGLTRSLPGDAAERFFASDLRSSRCTATSKILERCVAEWAGSPKEPARDDR
jgi:hypothetical protein